MANGLFNLKQVMQAVQQGGWPAQKTPAVEYLVVAGGGGGGAVNSGGGGAGGLLTGIDPVPNGQTLLVTVGGGGAGSVYSGGWVSDPVAGQNSVFGSISTTGGGAGGPRSSGTVAEGGSGGSGGGGGSFSIFTGNNVSGQGNAGGFGGDNDNWTGSGGGGAGTRGLNTDETTSAVPANGGAGIASPLAGLAVYAGGGGGGGRYTGTYSAGGVGGGGGGNGGVAPWSGIAGATNTGGGGGGGGVGGSTAVGGTGGSGIVSISYPVAYAAAASTVNATAMISGSGAMQFSGKNCVTFPLAQGYLSSSDFTIEAWVYPTTSASSQLVLIGQGDLGTQAGSSYYMSVGSGGDCSVYVGSGTYTSTAPNPTANQWSHVAFVRTGSTLSTYLNGTRVGTTSITGTVNNGDTTYKSSSGGISNGPGGANLTGYISNLRRIVGSGGYNATSSTITVPTSPLTATANTNLLVFQNGYSPYKDASSSAVPAGSLSSTGNPNNPPRGTFLTPFASTTYTNIARVYEWTTSGSITF